jgi:uncharacterized protein YbjT (DUF2867 family)
MTIVVTTPTGNVGSRVLELLIQAGERPRVLVRDPARLPGPVRERVEAVAVDQTDAHAVVVATEGAEALYWVAPAGSTEDPVAGYARLGEIAARAVTENGIARTVFQSSVGAEKRHGAGEIDGLARAEELLDATGAAVLHLRCGYFFSNLLLQLDDVRSGVLHVLLPVDRPMPWVAPRDVAEVAAVRLLSNCWSGRQVQAVHGPEDLSWERATAIVAEAMVVTSRGLAGTKPSRAWDRRFGRPLRVEQIPDDEMRATLEAATPTTLGAWAYDVLRPLLPPAASSHPSGLRSSGSAP